MNAIEKLKKLCIEPVCLCHGDGQISECVLDVGCPENCFHTEGSDPQVTEKTQCPYWQTVDPNPNIAAVLGPLAPEILAVLEAIGKIRHMEAPDPDEIEKVEALERAFDAFEAKAAEVLK